MVTAMVMVTATDMATEENTNNFKYAWAPALLICRTKKVRFPQGSGLFTMILIQI